MDNMISAIILAAGESRRMGQPKSLLPWGATSVLGKVVSTISAAGVSRIIVVTGGHRERVETLLADLALQYPLQVIHNPGYARGGMLSSIQRGIESLMFHASQEKNLPIDPGNASGMADAALVALGDQPQIREETVRALIAGYQDFSYPLVAPSFQNRRGHPWLVARSLWEEILALPVTITPRQFMSSHQEQVKYIRADESVLMDLDTPEDYAHQRP
jgi:molybdenum cofactor cytidylyltransferase